MNPLAMAKKRTDSAGGEQPGGGTPVEKKQKQDGHKNVVKGKKHSKHGGSSEKKSRNAIR